jgi:diadenosine tetraphosphate (Ap4A) HIT family hydrolase
VLSPTCIFCKIIQKTIPSTIITENEHVIVVSDIAPKAPTHYLIIPKIHVESVSSLTDKDAEYCWHMMKIARDLGTKMPAQAFNLIINNGAAAGQSIMHLHLHLLAGKNLYEHGLSL